MISDIIHVSFNYDAKAKLTTVNLVSDQPIDNTIYQTVPGKMTTIQEAIVLANIMKRYPEKQIKLEGK